MTLTRFFTTFVYLPLAVKLTRLSLKKAYSPALKFMIGMAVPTIVTFALAGLWHGAGWNFVIFGLIHGVALSAISMVKFLSLLPQSQRGNKANLRLLRKIT